ncbi:MAG: GAF domain-containing sensor histidine kinase [Magnetococcales bacterium]|nr:GAF domain-containing sensor histidine kinase [Magnetococcales bacterium]MBF0151097.1 GAF domain-containing sensor histidine kinase [Magnetococcales bacterium]
MTQTIERASASEGSSETTMTVQQINVIINRLLQLSLEPLSLSEYLDEVIYLLTAAPWLPIQNKGAIFLWDEQAGCLQVMAHVNLSPDHLALCQNIDLGQCLCGLAARSRKIIISDGVDQQHQLRPLGLEEHRDCCIPLYTEDRILGVLHLYPIPDHVFNEQDLTFFRAISSTLASAIIRFGQEEALKSAKAKAEEDARRLILQHEELLAADRLRASVEHITRHDLKTPLAGIVSFADMLLEQPDLDDTTRKGLAIILESGYRALHMVNLSLYLFQMEQGTYQLNQEPIDMVSVINKILRELAQQIERARTPIKIFLQDHPLEKGNRFFFLGEELLAYSMMANLIKNAVEASKPGQTITIRMLPTPPWARIEIHNVQPVDPRIRDRFFEKFVTSGKKFGTGLGTYSAKLIAETLKGSITMVSSETEGTTLTIVLPIPGSIPA